MKRRNHVNKVYAQGTFGLHRKKPSATSLLIHEFLKHRVVSICPRVDFVMRLKLISLTYFHSFNFTYINTYRRRLQSEIYKFKSDSEWPFFWCRTSTVADYHDVISFVRSSIRLRLKTDICTSRGSVRGQLSPRICDVLANVLGRS